MPILQGKDNTETWIKVIVKWLTFVIRLYVKEWRLSGINWRPVNSRKFKHNLTIGKQRRQNWVAIIIYLCVVINGSIKMSDKLSSKYRIMQCFVSLLVKKPMNSRGKLQRLAGKVLMRLTNTIQLFCYTQTNHYFTSKPIMSNVIFQPIES